MEQDKRITTTDQGKELARQTHTQQTWLEEFEKTKVTANMGLDQVVTIQAASLSSVNCGQKNTETGILTLEAMMLGIWTYLNGEWSPQQAQECAKMMFAEYYWMSIPELKHFALKCKQAHFTCQKDFSKFSPKHMAMCFEEYADMVLKERKQQFYLNKDKSTREITGPEVDATPYIAKMMEILGVEPEKELPEHTPITPEEYARIEGIDIDKLKNE